MNSSLSPLVRRLLGVSCAVVAFTAAGVVPVSRADSGPARSAPDDRWWTPQPELPLPRAGAATAWLGDRLVVAGGSYWTPDAKHWSDRVDAFDPSSRRWELAPPAPEAVSDAGNASEGSRLYLVGGSASGTASRHCWALEHQPGKWRWASLPDLPAPRAYGSAVLSGDRSGGRLYFSGGCTDPADLRTAARDAYSLDLRHPGRGWSLLPPLPAPARCLMAAAPTGDGFLILGGCTGTEEGKPRNLADVERWDPRRRRWERLPPLPYPVRGAAAIPLAGGGTGLFGGYSGEPDDLTRFGPSYGFERRTLRYGPGGAAPGIPLPFAAAGLSVARRRAEIWIAGGEDRARGRRSAVLSRSADPLRTRREGQEVWLCLGDSVTDGVGRSGVTGERTYPRQLAALAGQDNQPQVLGAGRGGETTAGAVRRFPDLLRSLPRVDRVIIMYGLNDAALIDPGPVAREAPRIPVSEYRENLHALVAETRRQGAEPVLCTPNPMTRAYLYSDRGRYAQAADLNFVLRNYAAAVRELAREDAVPLADVYDAFTSRPGWEKLLPDGIHPNTEGLGLIAETVIAALRPPASGVRRPASGVRRPRRGDVGRRPGLKVRRSQAGVPVAFQARAMGCSIFERAAEYPVSNRGVNRRQAPGGLFDL